MTATQNIQRLAVPVEADQGHDSVICVHFGKAPFFAIVDADGGNYECLSADNLRMTGECAPIQGLSQRGCRILFGQNMGRGALQRAHEAGLLIFHADNCRTVAELLKKHQEGLSIDLPDSALCNHHDHGHDHCKCGH
ncbi:NifB/NifX family molybdenum-iron cluster-binding protein [Cerasicoccus maritimus]|uniref:NifB/NifX family molybdenum-iron cluster-binding protein n=1 Tax=Cerasicoccus maritimus TaxID=490089 RepID=UPI00285263B5|nr:NifB/NifX family molybdenum-iron cluster-binding protein [Cerasicoccus maritimus]